MTRTYDTAIVLATCRRPGLLRRTLHSLAAARIPGCVSDVLVVENGGAHGAAEVVDRMTDALPVRHLLLAEGNKSMALNLALDRMEAEFVYFLDDDVRLGEHTIEAYVEAAGRYGRGHHFSGPLLPEWDEEPPEWLKPYLPASAKGWYHGDEEIYFDRPWFIGSNWGVFRRDALEVGGFREHIGPGSPTGAIGDEMELQQRLLDAGGRGVYLPGARIWHHVPAASCSFDWARRRQHLGGLTYGVLGWTPTEGPIADGLAGWARAAILTTKVLVARLLGWSDERRAWLEMTRARTLGYLRGRRVARHQGQLRTAPDPIGSPIRRGGSGAREAG